MTLNGSGIRDISRVSDIHPNTVLAVLRKAAAGIAEPPLPASLQDLELDEFWSFVDNKAWQRWTWYGFDSQHKQVVAFVNGRRTDANCRELLEKLQRTPIQAFYTDEGPPMRSFCRQTSIR